MSKKHKSKAAQAGLTPASPGSSHQAEYRIIKMDLIKVVILNVVYLAVILSLYYANQKSGLVDNWFARLLNF